MSHRSKKQVCPFLLRVKLSKDNLLEISQLNMIHNHILNINASAEQKYQINNESSLFVTEIHCVSSSHT